MAVVTMQGGLLLLHEFHRITQIQLGAHAAPHMPEQFKAKQIPHCCTSSS